MQNGFKTIEFLSIVAFTAMLYGVVVLGGAMDVDVAVHDSAQMVTSDDRLPHGRVLQKKDYLKSVRGDTLLKGCGSLTIALGNGKFKAIIGGPARAVIQKGDTFRIAKYAPKVQVSGIFDQVINEEMITRSSKKAPNYKISKDKKYIQFLFGGGSVPSNSMKTIDNGWIWNYDKYDIKIEVRTGIVKETLTLQSGAPVDYLWNIDSNEPKNLTGYGDFVIPDVKAVDAKGDSVLVIQKYTWNDGWVFSITIDTIGATFPIAIDPSVILKGASGADKDAKVQSDYPTKNTGTSTELDVNSWVVAIRRSYIQYDVSSIPTYAHVDSVLDSLYQYEEYNPTTPIKLMKVTSSWSELDITWNNQPTYDSVTSQVSWTAPNAKSIWGRISPDSGAVHDTLKNWVQQWIVNSSTNNGFVMRYENENVNDGSSKMHRFASSEYGTDSLKHSLTIYYTLVHTPPAPSVDSVNSNLRAILNGGSNPDSFSIFLYDSTKQQYVNTSGALVNRPVAHNIGDTVLMNYMSGNTWHKYATKVVSPGGDTSAYSMLDSSMCTIPWDSLKIYAIDTNKVQVRVDADTLAGADTIFTKIYDVNNDTLARDTLVFVSSLHIYTVNVDSLNKKLYVICEVRKSGMSYNSRVDSARTYSVKPTTVTWAWATDTSGVFTATKHGTMPVNSGYFLWDSVMVAAGSTKVYLHPDSLGYFSTKTYRSIASYNGTIKFPKNQLRAGKSIKFSLHAGNVDSTGAQ